MYNRRFSITAIFVLLLASLLSACQPIPPPVESDDMMKGEGQRQGFNLVAATKLVTDDESLQGYRTALSGYGTWDPKNPEDVEAGGSFAQFDAAAEGLPKPLVGLREGKWRAKRGIQYVAHGDSIGGITPGVLDMEVELIPNEGEPVDAILRVICNVGFGGMINMEDGDPLPEGFFLTIPDMGIFEPIISEEPGVPPLGLTHMGPIIPEVKSRASDEGKRQGFNLVAVTKLVTDDESLQGYRTAMTGYGTWDPENPEDVDAGGNFAQFDAAVEGLPKPLVGLQEGTWKATKGIRYVPYGDSHGGIEPGVLEMEVVLTPKEGEPVDAILRVICNVGFGGMINMEDGEPLPEGFFLTIPDMGTFEPIVSDEPGVPPLGLTHMGPIIPTLHQHSDMNDRFATETSGANGFARVLTNQAGEAVAGQVMAHDLLPNTEYQVVAAIQYDPSAPGPSDSGYADEVAYGEMIMSDADGNFVSEGLALGALNGLGTYRIDVFVTRYNAPGVGANDGGINIANVIDRDPTLACQPTFKVTLE